MPPSHIEAGMMSKLNNCTQYVALIVSPVGNSGYDIKNHKNPKKEINTDSEIYLIKGFCLFFFVNLLFE